MAGAAVSLRYVTGGATAVRQTFRAPSHVVLGAGLCISSFTALLPVLLGGAVLEHGEFEVGLPIFGDVKFVSALPFDIGVYLVVVGLVLMAFAAFGDDRPPGSAADGSGGTPADDLPTRRVSESS
jgi:multicomponent Na+:H+ antiporter subunit A